MNKKLININGKQYLQYKDYVRELGKADQIQTEEPAPENPYTDLFEDPINNIVLKSYVGNKVYEIYDFGGAYRVDIPVADYSSSGFEFTFLDKNTNKNLLVGILQYNEDEDHSVTPYIANMQKTKTQLGLKGNIDESEGSCSTRILLCIHDSLYAFSTNVICKLLSLNIVIVV